MVAIPALVCALLLAAQPILGEPEPDPLYTEHKVISQDTKSSYHTDSYSSTPDANTYYNYYASYPYRYRYATYPQKYYYANGAPASYYSDDTVYITDRYGQTRVSSARALATAPSYSSNTYSTGATFRALSNSVTGCTSYTCGTNAHCTEVAGRPVCSCLRGYTGDPISYCKRAECLDTSECRGHQTCRSEHCVSVCEGACGANANCDARNHVPVCSCPAGYTGDPFTHCRRFDPEELCHPSPCGTNTLCEVVNEVPTCKCLPGYHGSPLAGCRHECDSNAECGSHQACIEFRCQNPCNSQCGINAECETVANHAAVCKCPRGYFGNAYSSCQPECTTHSDCPRNKPACFYNSCKNPCDGVCGVGANCELRDITPICSCPRDMTGDPFVHCRPFEKADLCEPNPCGANAKCTPGYDRANNERPVCTCHAGYLGDPLAGCIRGECTEDAHCADSQSCVDYKCQNPCVNQCGTNANCNPRRHLAVCTCPPGYNGDALVNCYAVTGTAVGRYLRYK